jgi:hypothetical protein
VHALAVQRSKMLAGERDFARTPKHRGNSAHQTLLCIKARDARQVISAEDKLRRPE